MCRVKAVIIVIKGGGGGVFAPLVSHVAVGVYEAAKLHILC